MRPSALDLMLGQLVDGPALTAGILILLRWLPCVALAPTFGPHGLPALARVALALALTVLVYPAAAGAAGPLPTAGVDLALLGLRELLVGALLGLLVAVPLHAFESAGRLMDEARGARAEGPALPSGAPATPLGAFLFLYGLTLFVLVEGHLSVVAAAAESYRTLPLGATLPQSAPAEVSALVIHLGGQFFVVALGLAAPVIAVLLLLDLALGLAARVSPELSESALGPPLRALTGVAVLLLVLPALLAVFGGIYRLTLVTLEAGVRALGR
jgi:type III secretory pathway component EscT